jgi:ketosteroid isomerase-like protein
MPARPIPTSMFATALDCEAAFYECLQKGQADALMDVWADDEEIVCVHPGGPRLVGLAQVAHAWQEILRNGTLNVRVTERTVIANLSCAVHHLVEQLTVQNEGRMQTVVVCATNVYLKTPTGWRMIVHHASPAVQDKSGKRMPDHAPSRALH